MHFTSEVTAVGRAAEGMQKVRDYISEHWHTLSRSMLQEEAYVDPKLNDKPYLYLPCEMDMPPEISKLNTDMAVRVRHLPRRINEFGELHKSELEHHGLLYLPHPYVVPGGMFNEMYGWDSYFIVRGLLREGRFQLALGMVENLLFEVEHYGGVLNANRTYYLTRSQPPFLTSIIRTVYESGQATGLLDEAWLARAYRFAVKDYEFWTRAPHLAGETTLSRYFDMDEGPVPELHEDPTYYADVTAYLLTHGVGRDTYLQLVGPGIGPEFTLQLKSEKNVHSFEQRLRLSADFYKGDRAMRESGFDVSFRFGVFSGSTHHFAPVCLNSLLYKSECDLEHFSQVLHFSEQAASWGERKKQRQQRMNQLLWNKSESMYLDYNFVDQRTSEYESAVTFYPLWVGLASSDQAAAVMSRIQSLEKPGGLAMSTLESGAQWDAPYGWAPIQLIAAEGMRSYGFDEDADRVTAKFLSMVVEDFHRDGNLREKYNVITRSSQFACTAGYKANVVGFGWTNGAFLELLTGMRRELGLGQRY